MELSTAATLLTQGQILATPTDTVWGLLANATSPQAMAALQAAKGRPEGKPFLVLVKSLEYAQTLAEFSPQALAIAQTYWNTTPNPPLTLVLPAKTPTKIHPACLSLLPPNSELRIPNSELSIALRVPHHPQLQALLNALPFPLAAPSANKSGEPTCQTAAEIQLIFPQIAIFNPQTITTPHPSTIISFTQTTPQIIRPGSLTPSQISQILNL